ncbi:hypothetical protein [Inquilinus sp. CA228]|uniref:hypothetical protein n=1 Tax=Inquilinus sp. CA228 TaxID=3455609 RepID=UPI003F8D55A9
MTGTEGEPNIRAAMGEAGVPKALEIMRKELDISTVLTGTGDITEFYHSSLVTQG